MIDGNINEDRDIKIGCIDRISMTVNDIDHHHSIG